MDNGVQLGPFLVPLEQLWPVLGQSAGVLPRVFLFGFWLFAPGFVFWRAGFIFDDVSIFITRPYHFYSIFRLPLGYLLFCLLLSHFCSNS